MGRKKTNSPTTYRLLVERLRVVVAAKPLTFLYPRHRMTRVLHHRAQGRVTALQLWGKVVGTLPGTGQHSVKIRNKIKTVF